MSALARKMMEKYGWKEGEGLGKERTGTKSYVRVVRRDPHVATGLGHAADPAQSGNLASTHAVELDAIYGQLHKEKKKLKRARSSDSSSSSSDSASGVDETEETSSAQKKSRVAERPSRRQRDSSSDDDDDSGSSSDSNSGSYSSDDEDSEMAAKRVKGEPLGDVTRMTDKALFERCGGVRLGRAGRHRFFDGKLKRIHGNQ
ncbi:hypothetical protein ABB37_07952 [Leptomonas pyrrhocoris]|uniref:G-patch domain-containing protein n=1 Tax=Leptomonas pyrrhocoris TaxID=157538 RepID=A0A0N0DSN7_LEPPY|nr:hypothetical protein ABB37_07952 [Leptomonas pyrrhocoris]KPA76198.1 hypothetical protein ABB37_07952 [Leptomonas pyrrhocoris]|eukprot:XP_015654637.1 hypothetical protein ABB37_07952 [Leptomonas pyrrhocoris]